MKCFNAALFLTVMLSIYGLTACKHTEQPSGSSAENKIQAVSQPAQAEKPEPAVPAAAQAENPESAVPTAAQAEKPEPAVPTSDESMPVREDKPQSAEANLDIAEQFNPSYTQRPPKEAFYNQIELKLNGKFTHAAVVPAVISDVDEQTCANEDCASAIHFEDASIAPAHVPSTLGLELTNLGDLNGDGNDEIGAVPEWWSSVWQAYHILTLKDGVWHEMLVPGVDVNIEYMREHPYIPAEKILERPGYIRVRALDPDSMQLEEREIGIPGVFLEHMQ